MPRRRRKIQDKWRLKTWYDIHSPPYFGEAYLCAVPCSDSDKMIGRVVEKTLYELTDDFAQQHLKLFFKITDVKGNTCSTMFHGHEYSREYLRGLVRRRSSRIDDILNVTTKDGYKVRVSIVVLSAQNALFQLSRSRVTTGPSHPSAPISSATAASARQDDVVMTCVPSIGD